MANINTNPPTQLVHDLVKKCRKCGIEKPATLEFFYKNSGGKYGLTPRCKPCVGEDNAKWANENPDRVRANAKVRSKRHYHKDIEAGRKRAREHAAKTLADPAKRERIYSRRRAGGSGLTPEQIDAMRQKQNNRCAICDDPNPTDLDHCHNSKRVRWMLCRHCNRGLGAFRDNPFLMRKAAQMMEKFHEATR